jgi:hypothetical protein
VRRGRDRRRSDLDNILTEKDRSDRDKWLAMGTSKGWTVELVFSKGYFLILYHLSELLIRPVI